MGKVLWHVTMSLDGFIAGPKGEMDWTFGHSGVSPEMFQEIIRTTGAMVAGRRSVNLGPDTGKKVYGGALQGQLFVLTRQPPPESVDPTITFFSGDVRDVIATALESANGKNVVVTGANVARQCIEAGLVDELLIHLVPVLVGDGVRLFDNPGGDWVALETISVEGPGDMANLRYRVVKK
ncbi:dihydrofolate reductase family protein [Streptosporangium sp. NPDC051022]|uniref:dihydrofolate reductase family protein n=1 Tax=Streptosporangium sp. NPDC051022 TaxID=3155752 RepID=UPI003446A804